MGPRPFASIAGFVAFASIVGPARAQSIVRVDVASDGTEPTGQVLDVGVSDDGTKVVFTTYAALVPADTNARVDVYVRDLVAGTTTLVSARPDGSAGNDSSNRARISADGRFVAFESLATDLVADDDNGVSDVFLRDLAAGTTQRVSVAPDGSGGDGASFGAAISADGKRVLFASDADDLVDGDTDGWTDVFVRDIAAGTTTRVSTALDGTEGDGPSYPGDLSRDGNVVAFPSYASNLIDGDPATALGAYARDLAGGTLVRASVAADGSALDQVGGVVVLSPDGTLVAFAAFDSDVVPGDDDGTADAFLRDLVAGTTTAVSVDSAGRFGTYDDPYAGSAPAGISADGRFVLMSSAARDLAPNESDVRDPMDVYVRDRELAMTTRQSNAPDGFSGAGKSAAGAISADGRYVAFWSDATDLIDGHPTSGSCAFLRTRPLRDAAVSGYGDGLAGSHGEPTLDAAAPLRLNQPYDVALGNSLGSWTVALLLIGTESAQLPTSFGGDLLVLPIWTRFLVVAPGGSDLTGTVPSDESLAGMSLYLQALEIDAGAPRGISFTAGLEIEAGF